MLNGKTVNIDMIIEQLYQDYGFENIDQSEVAEWIWRSMGIIGCPEPYIDKPVEITITDYRSILPIDLYSIGMVRDQATGTPLREMTDQFGMFIDSGSTTVTEVIGDYDPASDSLVHYDTILAPDTSQEYYTYKVQGNYIYFGMETGTVEMQYKAIPIDIITGLPTVPDNIKYIRGIVSFIGERMAFRMMLKDQLSERKYDLILKDYLFNVGAAQSVCKMPDAARMETLINRWKSTYIGPEHFNTGFKHIGSRE